MFYKHPTTLKLTVNKIKHGSQEKTQERERTWSKNLFPTNATKASAAVPRIEETRENSEKIVVCVYSQKNHE